MLQSTSRQESSRYYGRNNYKEGEGGLRQINSCRQVLCRSTFKKRRHLGFGVFIVIWSKDQVIHKFYSFSTDSFMIYLFRCTKLQHLETSLRKQSKDMLASVICIKHMRILMCSLECEQEIQRLRYICCAFFCIYISLEII